MINHRLAFADVFDPLIKIKLLQMVAKLQQAGYQLVSDINYRLTKWVDGNERGKYIVDHYKEMGFYYIEITGGSVSQDLKTTINYNFKNLFDDTVAFTSTERFKQYPDWRLETQNYYNAGFRFFQEQGTPGMNILPHWDSRFSENKTYKVMFTRSSSVFNPETITQGTGGGTPGSGQTGGGTPGSGTPGSGQTGGGQSPQPSNIMETLKTAFDNNPIYFVLAGGLILYFVFKD